MLEKGEENVSALVVRRVHAPADPHVLAARVRSMGDLAVLAAAPPPGAQEPFRSYVAAGAVERGASIAPPGAIVRGVGEGRWAFVPRWVGAIPYESARGLERGARQDLRERPHHMKPAWRRYGAVLVVDHQDGIVTAVGDDEERVRELAEAAETESAVGVSEGTIIDEESASRHRDRIEAALSLIAAGDLYQVNLARRLRLHLQGDLLSVLARLTAAAPSTYGAGLFFSDSPAILSTSPELFLRITSGGAVLTEPIKGTRPRGRDEAEDAAMMRELDADPKERAELTMVIDLERNDLGRVAELGTVRVPGPPRVVTHRTLHHRVAQVAAQLRPGTSLAELLGATFPSGSVTGAPKVRAMEVIAELEESRRGLYTGALGFVAHDGSMTLAMAIRTLTAAGDGRGGWEAHYHTGGGIVAGSDPGREVEETRTKALQLAALIGGDSRTGR